MRIFSFLLLGLFLILTVRCQEDGSEPSGTETPLREVTGDDTTEKTETTEIDDSGENPFDENEDAEVEEETIDAIIEEQPIASDEPVEGELTTEPPPLEPLELDAEEEKELEDHKEEFVAFHKKFRRNFKKADVPAAAKNFKANNRRLRALRKKKRNFKVGMHPYMHLAKDKIKKLFIRKDRKRQALKLMKVGLTRKRLGAKKPRGKKGKPARRRVRRAAAALPKSFDWRRKNVMNPVRDQGDCGSCWTFSATAVVEANYARKYKKKADLSEQQLTCVYKEGTICEGGYPDEALKYIQKNGGQATEIAFPYKDKYKSTCKKAAPRAKIQAVGDLLPFNMRKVKQAIIKHGPIAFGMYVNDDFMNYEAGVFDSPCTPKDDGAHAMTIVGYGEDPSGVPYWIVRNQWGKDWGEKGHIRVKAGVDLCGIESMLMVQATVE